MIQKPRWVIFKAGENVNLDKRVKYMKPCFKISDKQNYIFSMEIDHPQR